MEQKAFAPVLSRNVLVFTLSFLVSLPFLKKNPQQKQKKSFPWSTCFYLLEGLFAWCHSGTSAAQMGCLVCRGFFFSTICLEQPPLQDHQAWWRAVDDPFGSSSFDMGLLSPDTFPSTTATLLIPSAPLKQGKLPGGESIIALAQSATFNVRAQMENVHSTTRTQWCTDLLSHPPHFEKVGKEFSAHPFIVIINHPEACWKIIYCTCKWLTTQK